MLTRTRNALWIAGFGAAIALGLGWASHQHRTADLRPQAIDAVPSGALLVATADLDALRASPVGAPLLKQGREIPGLGKVRDLCGFDPVDSVHEIAVAIPAGGDAGDFGLVAAGEIDADALVACASKVISARGGQPVVTPVSGFRVVRDGSSAEGDGEIAVREHGPVLLGAGTYLRAMIDTAEGRTKTARESAAHSMLVREVGPGAVRVSVVLTPDQRDVIAFALKDEGSSDTSAASLAAASVAVVLGQTVGINVVLVCDQDRAAEGLARSLEAARAARSQDLGTRLIGLGAVLERTHIEPKGAIVTAHVDMPVEEATTLLDRVLTLRGFRHPMPSADAPRSTGSVDRDAGAPSPDEVLHAPTDSSASSPSSSSPHPSSHSPSHAPRPTDSSTPHAPPKP